ncbi:alpha/beta hydrolase [Mucilaginibacter sp. BJC16-A38]|uniref:alpha/beta hydrolase n=1 Tax=Mucilaginibacter phenanthrenivorans TaxID=1234842 RepID=UPI0021572D3F|nr:alpha/beta hydrolase [Mucilaginibacter phenanthrenivorans]MCR8556781.1 alpha/beta hydrolase [Mucilaginibacter phenanthrenivorans]
MSKVFLIAGLGADTRAYDKISIEADEIIRVDWIEPDKTDTLKLYSQKLIHQYNITHHSIVIGNSLGGMIAMEIAKEILLERTILISSIKTIDEAPWYFSLFKVLPVYKLIPGKLFTSMGFMIRFVFGKMNKADNWLFNDMLKKSSPKFVKWAMGAALHWDNKIIPKNVYTITGDKDDVFDYRRINDAIIVKGGTHIMIFDRAEEVNRILKEIIEK